MKISLLLFLAWSLLSFYQCRHKGSKEALSVKAVPTGSSSSGKPVARKSGELRFRRSYANNQFKEMSDSEYNAINKSNPLPYSVSDTSLMKQFRKFGLTGKENGLRRSKFNKQQKKSFSLANDSGKNVDCLITRPPTAGRSDKYILRVISENEQSEVEIEGWYGYLNEDIKFLILDIIPGGFREIIFLHEYYIMNGDNSDIYVYEIKIS